MRGGKPCHGVRLLRQMDPARTGARGLRRFARRFFGAQYREGGAPVRLRCAWVSHGAGIAGQQGGVSLHRALVVQPLCRGARHQKRHRLFERSRQGRGQDQHGGVRPGVHGRLPAARSDRRFPARRRAHFRQGLCVRALARREGSACLRCHYGGDHIVARHCESGAFADFHRPLAHGRKPRLADTFHGSSCGDGVGPSDGERLERGIPAARRRQDGGFVQRELHVEGAPSSHGVLLAAHGRRHRFPCGHQCGHRPKRGGHACTVAYQRGHAGGLPGYHGDVFAAFGGGRHSVERDQHFRGTAYFGKARQHHARADARPGEPGVGDDGGHLHGGNAQGGRRRGRLFPPVVRLSGLCEHPGGQGRATWSVPRARSTVGQYGIERGSAGHWRVADHRRAFHDGHAVGVPRLPGTIQRACPELYRQYAAFPGDAHGHGAHQGRHGLPVRPVGDRRAGRPERQFACARCGRL